MKIVSKLFQIIVVVVLLLSGSLGYAQEKKSSTVLPAQAGQISREYLTQIQNIVGSAFIVSKKTDENIVVFTKKKLGLKDVTYVAFDFDQGKVKYADCQLTKCQGLCYGATYTGAVPSGLKRELKAAKLKKLEKVFDAYNDSLKK